MDYLDVRIQVSSDDLLIFEDWLVKYEEENRKKLQDDPVILQVINNVICSLEKENTANFSSDYKGELSRARGRLRKRYLEDGE